MSRKRPGRPKGSTNTAAEIFVEPSRCPTCGSSRRTNYENPFRRDYVGLEYIAIIYRTCRCVDCGQARRDKERVYAPKERNSIAVITRPELGCESGLKAE